MSSYRLAARGIVPVTGELRTSLLEVRAEIDAEILEHLAAGRLEAARWGQAVAAYYPRLLGDGERRGDPV